jgi:hypothetical protein
MELATLALILLTLPITVESAFALIDRWKKAS